MPGPTKKEADAYDRVVEAAAELYQLIEQSGIEIGEYELEELSLFLARNAVGVKEILKPVSRARSSPG